MFTGNPLAGDFVRLARAYAERLGWPVIPLHQPSEDGGCSCSAGPSCKAVGKHPRVADWPSMATTDPQVIREWGKRWPTANIGLVTGATSGIVVVDVDPRHGGDVTLEVLEEEHGAFPETVEAITGGGGRHLLFLHPGGHVGNDSAGEKLGPGLDIRGDGGLIVAPRSLHASGRRYEWEGAHRPGEVALAPIPDWLRFRLQNPTSQVRPRLGPTELESLILEKNTQPNRTPKLCSLAGVLLSTRLPSRGVMDLLVAWDATHNNPPLGPEAVARTLSGILATRSRGRRSNGGIHA